LSPQTQIERAIATPQIDETPALPYLAANKTIVIAIILPNDTPSMLIGKRAVKPKLMVIIIEAICSVENPEEDAYLIAVAFRIK
jgi:hypothetical protein